MPPSRIVPRPFLDLVHAALEIIEREGRIGHRALKRHLEVADDTFDDLVAEVVSVRRAATDVDGAVLVWNGSPSTIADAGRAPAEPAPQPSGERRQLTIMFCDLVGSCAMSGSIDPEDLRDVLTSYYGAAARAVAPLGGHVAEYLGDGLVVYFGYPKAVEDAAVRAVRAGLAVLDAIAAINRDLIRDRGIELQVRIGVHTGQVVLTEVGEDSRRATQALGEVPNVAARLQQVAGPDELVVSDVTERLVRGFFELEPLGPQSLKGIVTPISAFRVAAAKDVETRFDAAVGQFTGFVGRAGELDRLTAAWAAVRAGGSGAVLVRGEAGIGKSRLVQTIGDRGVEEGGQHVRCRCSAHHRSTAYFPISDLIARRLGFRPSDTADDRVVKLRDGMAGLGLDDGELQSIASVLSLRLPEDGHPQPARLPQEQKAHNLAALRHTVERIAAQAPVVLTVEDVHWIDPTSAEFFARLRMPRVLVVLTSRPESDLAWTAPLEPLTIELGRLPRDDARQLIANVTGGRALPRGLVEELLAKTEGIPLFIEEQTKAVLESKFVVERDGGWELTRPLREMRIAETLEDSIRARLDRLDRDSRDVAQLAATLGRSFTHELLEAVASTMPPTLLLNAVTRLQEAGLLVQHGDAQHTAYFFHHALVQDVAYQSLLKSKRREYHLACAEALVTWFPETEQTQPELIAHHCHAGGDVPRAIKYYELAGQLAAKHWALHEAADHLKQALALLDELPDDSKRRRRELGILFALGPALMSTLGYANKVVEDTYRRIRELCESEGLQAKMFPALVGLWQHHMVGGSLERAKGLGTELLWIAEGVDNVTLRLIATRALGTTLFLLGDFRGALDYTSAGWRMYDVDEHGRLAVTHGNDPGVAHGVYLAWALWTVGRPDEALAQAQATIDLANRLKHPMSIAFSHAYAAIVANLRGDFALGEQLAARGCEVAHQHGLALWSANARVQVGWARIGLGDPASGAACVEEATAAWLQTGAGSGTSLMYAVVAEAYLAMGDLAAADARLAQAEATIAKTGERFYEAEILRLRGELARSAGDAAAARRWFAHGLDVARAQGARAWELRLCTSLAGLLRAGGRDGEARAVLDEAMRNIDGGRDTRDVLAARRLAAAR